MKQILFYIGGILLVIGAVMPLFQPTLAPWIFALGALLFASMQIAGQHYEGSNLIIRRLYRQQILGALLLVVTAIMMFMQLYGIPPFRGSEWKIALLIAVLLETYSIFRIEHEEKKGK